MIPADLYFSNFVPHLIFSGIDQIYYRAAGGLGVVAPGSPIARTDDDAHITIADVEYHCVVALGDANAFEDDYLQQADNQAFGINLFNYLRDCFLSTPVQPTTWGRVKSLY